MPNERKALLCVHPGLNYENDVYIPFLINELRNTDTDIVVIHARGDYNVKSNVRNVYHMSNHEDISEIYNYLHQMKYKTINSVG